MPVAPTSDHQTWSCICLGAFGWWPNTAQTLMVEFLTPVGWDALGLAVIVIRPILCSSWTCHQRVYIFSHVSFGFSLLHPCLGSNCPQFPQQNLDIVIKSTTFGFYQVTEPQHQVIPVGIPIWGHLLCLQLCSAPQPQCLDPSILLLLSLPHVLLL